MGCLQYILLQVMHGCATLGFPYCMVAMDSCHIYIRAVLEDPDAYINWTNQHSVLLQGMVDHSDQFMDVSVGNTGRDHDAHVLHSSNIFNVMDTGMWVPGNPTFTIEGVHNCWCSLTNTQVACHTIYWCSLLSGQVSTGCTTGQGVWLRELLSGNGNGNGHSLLRSLTTGKMVKSTLSCCELWASISVQAHSLQGALL